VSPVRYELDFHIPEDGILHSQILLPLSYSRDLGMMYRSVIMA
jgi:hypothetical protein